MRFDTALQMQRDNGSHRFAPNDPISPECRMANGAITVAAKDRLEHVKGKYDRSGSG